MDTVIENSTKIIATLGKLFKRDDSMPEFEVLSKGLCDIEVTGFDNWNGGTDIYGIFCRLPIDVYSKYEHEIQSIEQSIRKKAEMIFRIYPNCWVGEVVISPELSGEMDGKAYTFSVEELLELLEQQKAMMISVSTGGPMIKTVNSEYKERAEMIEEGLLERGMVNTNQFEDLWTWHGKWSDGSLPNYASRRKFVSELFGPMLEAVKNLKSKVINPVFEEPTGWGRVDRSVGEIKLRLTQASTEEQYQAIGLLCRETLISIAQEVFIEEVHPILDGVTVSKTDAKRMLEAYIAHELSGSSNEQVRKHAKASLALANDLTHKRTAEYRLAALCAEATNAVVNIIAIISGRRDPR
ncbi:hypothetical protein [Hydrogenovibrio thermophilus]|jgi:hypothetical protein|uniref:Uncharacterized protein n=1 Tax=Hydrogenovibrio thermophilus TaxID=265883 RepID=A0A410H215_9GAMM|nr:hypothetical protein [Hydrogenovibrio thermophilus]QAB14951.1 hypothetical protein EPV75_04325 [Hydrogenovibrio thermophilus]